MTWYLNDKTNKQTKITLWKNSLFTHWAPGSDFILTPTPLQTTCVILTQRNCQERGEHINDNILKIVLCQSVFIAFILKLHFVRGHLKSYVSFATSQQWFNDKGIYPFFKTVEVNSGHL